jgi:cytidylate kinase
VAAGGGTIVPPMVIAIDGPAGAGKSTVARALAQRLGFTYMDSGAMYRCVGLAALERGMELGPGPPVPMPAPATTVASGAPRTPGELARAVRIELGDSVTLDGRDVSAEIRSPAVSEAASQAAADPEVRAAMVERQRELIADGDWVAEGRDIGTVVAPDAELKVFLTANARVRAGRRARELEADAAVVLAEQALRDARDTERVHSPLRPAPGALVLDTSELGVEEVVARIVEAIPA